MLGGGLRSGGGAAPGPGGRGDQLRRAHHPSFGYSSITFNSYAKTTLQLASDPSMRGRLMALWALAWDGTTVIGGPLVGWIAEELGSRWSLIIGGLPTVIA